MRMEMLGEDGYLVQVTNRQNHVTFRRVVLFVGGICVLATVPDYLICGYALPRYY